MSRGDDAKKNTRSFRLPVNVGLNSDGFGEDVPLHDLNNFVLTPDGSALKPREGFEIRRNDAIGYSSGRKLISFMSNPPDIDYGDMIMVTNTKNGRAFVELTEVVRGTNTVSLENPMSMPDLPDPSPEGNAVILHRTDSGGSGSPVYYGKVMVYSAATSSVVGPVTLNEVSYDYYSVVYARSEDYLVTRGMGSGAGMQLKVWDIDAMIANPEFTHDPLRTINVFEDDVFDDGSRFPVFMYEGNIAFVCGNVSTTSELDFKIYRVDLSSGAVTVQDITGLPEGFEYFSHNGLGPSSVDTGGYLCVCGYRTWGSNYSFTMLKIDPVTGVAVSYGDNNMFAPFSDFYGMVPLPGGSVLSRWNTGSEYYIISNDLQAVTPAYGPSLIMNDYPGVFTGGGSAVNTSCLVGTVGLSGGVSGSPWLVVADFSTGIAVGAKDESVGHAEYPASVMDENTVAVCGYDNSTGAVYLYRGDVSTGDITRGSALTQWEVGWGGDFQSYNAVPDAWGYGVKNMQGNRL